MFIKNARTVWMLAALGLAALSVGCEPLAELNAENVDNGLVVVLPGIDGPSLSTLGVMATMASRTDLAVGQFNWTIPFVPLVNQTATGRNRDMARLLADRIVDYRRRHPDRPVYLIGHSGGTAVAVWTAEALPADVKVDGIFLLASSLSPGYNLSRAIAQTRGPIVNVYSKRDSGLLGGGTSMIGTMDGRHGSSAGHVGFRSRGTWGYGDRLIQIPWKPAMSKLGYNGDHFSVCSPAFLESYVIPRMGDLTSQRPAGPVFRGGRS